MMKFINMKKLAKIKGWSLTQSSGAFIFLKAVKCGTVTKPVFFKLVPCLDGFDLVSNKTTAKQLAPQIVSSTRGDVDVNSVSHYDEMYNCLKECGFSDKNVSNWHKALMVNPDHKNHDHVEVSKRLRKMQDCKK